MPYPHEKSENPVVRELENCGCCECLEKADSIEPLYGGLNWISNRTNSHMIVCSTCGNKRCPRATSHQYLCTNSNVPNQIPTDKNMTKITEPPVLEIKTEDCVMLTTEGTISNYLQLEECDCEMHINSWFAISIPKSKLPNKFHRFMQKLIFGFTYTTKK